LYYPSHLVEKLIFVPDAGRGILLPLTRLDYFSSESRLLEVEITHLTAEEIS